MRSALSHTKRVMERNFQTILREIPNGGEFRITGHGIVIRKGLNMAQGDETDRINNRMNRQNPDQQQQFQDTNQTMDRPAGPQQPLSTGPIGRGENGMNRGGIRGRGLGRQGSQAGGTPHYRGGSRGRELLYNGPLPLNNEGQY